MEMLAVLCFFLSRRRVRSGGAVVDSQHPLSAPPPRPHVPGFTVHPLHHMKRKYAPAPVAGVVGFLSSLTTHIIPLLNQLISLQSPISATRYAQAGQFVSFLFVYGLLLGTAYWTGNAVHGRNEATKVAALSGITGALGYFIAFLVFVYPLGATAFTDLPTTALLTIGPPMGVGVKLGVVTVAGIAVRQLQ